tara:strand:- start:431 stop:1408 length:978 start_codon:yes stop_codon:yes gene_type:complete
MSKKYKFGNLEFEAEGSFFQKPKRFILFIISILCVYTSVYTVDANETAVILRLGKFLKTTDPGLQLKFPLIDSVYKVKVDYQYKQEFGFRTIKPGVKSHYSTRGYEDESWMLTGDLKIADVRWVVQYKIYDPKKFLFNVKNIDETIFDVSESVMRLMIGDRSFIEVIQAERITIASEAKNYMQSILDKYNSGISVQMVQLQGVVPPEPVADSFNEVNRAKQEQETLINEALQEYNKQIYRIEGEAQKTVTEAEGYAIQRVNEAKGDANLFNAIFEEYQKQPQITKDRLFIEAMNEIYSNNKNKIIVDKDIENIVPFLNKNEMIVK